MLMTWLDCFMYLFLFLYPSLNPENMLKFGALIPFFCTFFSLIVSIGVHNCLSELILVIVGVGCRVVVI